MNLTQTERRQLIKWTMFLLAFVGTLLLIIMAILIFVLMLSSDGNTTGLLFVSAGSLGFGYWILQTRKGLIKGSASAWSSATIIASLSLPSIALPFAVLSLNELLSESKRTAFLRTSNGPAFSETSSPSPTPSQDQDSTKMASVVIAAVVGLVVFGAKVGLHYKRLVGTGESPKAAEYQVDPKLSLPELAKLGARCNSEGNMACSHAVYQKILALDPSDMTALANLAMAESQSGSHPEAIKHFQMYFTQGGRAVDAMFYMAKSLNALGKKQLALDWCNRALLSAPNLVDVAEYSTRLMLQLGRHAEATTFINNFTTKYPDAKPYFEGLKTEAESRKAPQTSITI